MNLRDFFAELKRRNVYKVAIAYAIVAWLLHADRNIVDHRGFDLISEALPFGRLWYGEPDAITNAISYANFRSRSHRTVIRIYDEAGNVIETLEHKGDFKEW